jgi:hypothetical protein
MKKEQLLKPVKIFLNINEYIHGKFYSSIWLRFNLRINNHIRKFLAVDIWKNIIGPWILRSE